MSRGYFEIGICHGKTPSNVGTLWRSAYQMGYRYTTCPRNELADYLDGGAKLAPNQQVSA